MIASFFRRIRDLFFILIILTYTIFETLIWEQAVKPIFKALAALKLYRRFLDYIRCGAPREIVLVLFVIPFVIGEVLGTLSGILAAQLYLVSAAIVYACKIPLVVVALAILENGKEKLLSYPWFERAYTWVLKQLEKLHNAPLYIKTMNVFRVVYHLMSDKIKQVHRKTMALVIHLHRKSS